MEKQSVLQARISKAVSVISQNQEGGEGYAISKQILTALNDIGVDDSEMGIKILDTEMTRYEDFRAKYPVIVPEAKLRIAWEILKGRDPFAPSLEEEFQELAKKAGKKVEDLIKETGVSYDEFKKIGRDTALKLFKKSLTQLKTGLEAGADGIADILKANRPVGQWHDTEVLEHYGKHCSSDIEAELVKRSKGRNCIIFNDDGYVDVKNSLEMLRLARYQDMPGTIGIPGCCGIKVLYKVGEFPADVLYECPIHGNVLLVNGYCEDCGKVWDVGDYERNVFLRLISENYREDIGQISLHFADSSLESLQQKFAKVVPIYEGMKVEGTLPSLKRRVSRSKSGDPFRVSHVRH